MPWLRLDSCWLYRRSWFLNGLGDYFSLLLSLLVFCFYDFTLIRVSGYCYLYVEPKIPFAGLWGLFPDCNFFDEAAPLDSFICYWARVLDAGAGIEAWSDVKFIYCFYISDDGAFSYFSKGSKLGMLGASSSRSFGMELEILCVLAFCFTSFYFGRPFPCLGPGLSGATGVALAVNGRSFPSEETRTGRLFFFCLPVSSSILCGELLGFFGEIID